MKVLIVEEKGRHPETSIIGVIDQRLKVGFNLDSKTSTNIHAAARELGIGKFELAVIHQWFNEQDDEYQDFSLVDSLRSQFPTVKYAAYSGGIRFLMGLEQGQKELKKWKQHYDYLLANFFEPLEFVVQDMKKRLGEA